MDSQIVRCPCGHAWEWQSAVPPPADVRTVCPVCSASTPKPAAAQQQPLPDPSDIEPVRWLFPGFEVLEEINRGGMGIVFKARQLGLNRIVALKVISPERIEHPRAMDRFQREVRAAALLSDPHIVTVFQTDLTGPYPYLAMEFVDGVDLATLVQRTGWLPVADALQYVRQAAQGLQHAFEKGMVHRDIKPANLMVTPSPIGPGSRRGSAVRAPIVKILDMGLARTDDDDDEDEATQVTRMGVFLGTPDYVAPEQAEDPRQATIQSDIYALGASLHFLLTGEVPYPGGTLIQKVKKQLTLPPPQPSKRRPELPAAMDALVARMMAKDPAERFESPADVIAAIDRILQGGQSPAPARPAAPAAAVPVSRPSHVHAHANGVQSLSVSTDGQQLLTGGLDGTVRLWDAQTFQELRCFTQDAGPVRMVALAPSGKWAASCAERIAAEDMVVSLYDVAAGAERRRLRGHTENVTCLAIDPASRRIASGSEDRTVRIWTLDAPSALVLTGHTDTVTAVKFLPGGHVVASAALDGTVRLWDAANGQARSAANMNAGRLACVDVGLGNRLAVAGDGASNLRLRQPDGQFLDLFGHRGPVTCVCFSADGKLLLSIGRDRVLCVWRTAHGDQIARFEGNTGSGRLTAAAFAPDGRSIFTGGGDGNLRRWLLG